MERIKVSAVSYLNTKPFLYGIENSPVRNQIDLSLDMPSMVADKLISGKVQVGLVPVAVIPQMPVHHIITNYCIGCNGEVGSVCIYSTVPIEKVTQVLLDYQSRTSVELAKVLLREYWKVKPQFIPATPGFEQLVEGTRAAVVIGDRTFELKKKYAYCYDMGKTWQELTGRPFVFAAWVSNRELPVEFIQSFNEALRYGVNHIDKVVEKHKNEYPQADVKKYLTKNISYPLSIAKRYALELFLEKMKKNGK